MELTGGLITKILAYYSFMILRKYFIKNKEKSIGERGEDLAVKYLKKKGYRVLERNWRNKKGYQVGEIDIIAQKEGQLVFVEVKTGEVHTGYNDPLLEERITHDKLRKLERISQDYLYYKNKQQYEYRFDAVLVYISGKDVKFRHLENIFI
jgi:putative endonuclease